MKPNTKKQLPVLLLLPCLGQYGHGLGLGEASIESVLGAPLQADIPLIEYQGDPIVTTLASRAVHQRLGIERTHFQSRLRFELIRNGDEALVRVSSADEIKEPYVSFALNIQWPEGSLVKSYTLLVDPALPAPNASPAILAEHTPGKRFSSSIHTRSGDSLWRLAKRLQRPAGSNIAQLMNAIYQLNPQAFVGADASKLKPHMPIRVPDAATINAASRRFVDTSAAPASKPVTHTAEAKPAPPGSADAKSPASDALPTNNKLPDATKPGLRDQLEGIKAGIAAAEAGKVRSKAHINVLDQELNALVERYEAIAARTREVEQQLAQRNAGASAAISSISPNSAGKSLLSFAACMTAFGIAGAWIGHALARPRKAGRKKHPSARSTWFRKKTEGSATYEQPYDCNQVPAKLVSRKQASASLESAGPIEDDASLVAAGYTAFGLYDEAETVLAEASITEPERIDIKLQLLELYSTTDKPVQFEGLAEVISDSSDDPDVNTRVELLRLQISANDDTPDQHAAS